MEYPTNGYLKEQHPANTADGITHHSEMLREFSQLFLQRVGELIGRNRRSATFSDN